MSTPTCTTCQQHDHTTADCPHAPRVDLDAIRARLDASDDCAATRDVRALLAHVDTLRAALVLCTCRADAWDLDALDEMHTPK